MKALKESALGALLITVAIMASTEIWWVLAGNIWVWTSSAIANWLVYYGAEEKPALGVGLFLSIPALYLLVWMACMVYTLARVKPK